MKLRSGVAAVSFALGLAVVLGAWAFRLRQSDEGVSGLRVAGTAVSPSTDIVALVEQLAARLESEPVELSSEAGVQGGARVLRATLSELGFSVDRELVVGRARSSGRTGVTLDRAHEHGRRRGAELPLALHFDAERFLALLAPLKAREDQPAAPARLRAAERVLAPHVAGRYLDLERLSDSLWSLAKSRAHDLGSNSDGFAPARISMPVVTIAPRVSVEAAAELGGELEVLSEYTTRFRTRGDQATRAQNIAVAAQRLDGWILLPGDRMSFNDVVGERSEENGFEESWQILEGEMVRGMGGGTCQVSSTLHAAALHAGLKVVESYPHSRPLAYIDKGLDATVAWPFVDLKLQNPWPVALAIQAIVREGSLTFRFLAKTKPATIRIRRDTKGVVPFPRIVEVSRSLRGFKRKQEGIPGYEIERVRYILPASGEPRREVQTSRYRPTPELYLIGPDFDEQELPPLPEGAEGHSPDSASVELQSG